MRTHLVSFATPRYYASQRRLGYQALRYGIDVIHAYNMGVIKRTAFYKEHHDILSLPRGAGYWLWKPYLIYQTLKHLPDGDVVLYCDCDICLLDDLSPLLALADKQPIVLFTNHDRLMKTWTKRDVFVYLNCDTHVYYDAEQLVAGYQLYKNGDISRGFVKEYLALCTDKRLLLDGDNVCGLNNAPEFQEHRHDQSILSLIALKKQYICYRDPSYRGNHLKATIFRQPDEKLIAPYSSEPWMNSAYGTIFDINAPLEISTVDRLRTAFGREIRRPFRWVKRMWQATHRLPSSG